jgi:hypothetical protein
MAWPVPLATTRTSMPVLSSNFGSSQSNSPESAVEVVEATMMNRSAAAAQPTPRTRYVAANAASRRMALLTS